MPDEVLIQANALGMTFPGGHAVLQGINFGIHSGEFVSIVGPSGCGKSTLLRLLAGLLQPSSGTLSVSGRPISEPETHAQQVAFVFQDPTLLPWRSVTDNIRLPLEMQRLPRREQQQRIDESLNLIGLSAADARKYPRMLSGGMRMRVSLARALVTRPDVLLLDEPFGALDDIMRQRLNEDLLKIWATQQRTAVFVTHNVSEAVFLSRRILVMQTEPGRISAEIEVPFAYPREPDLRATGEFAKLTGEVSRRLRGAAA